MEDIEETREGRVTRVAAAVAHVLGQVRGHRAMGSEQTEEVDRQPRYGIARGLEGPHAVGKKIRSGS